MGEEQMTRDAGMAVRGGRDRPGAGAGTDAGTDTGSGADAGTDGGSGTDGGTDAGECRKTGAGGFG